MTVDLAQLAWIMYVLILGAVFFFVVYLVRILKDTLPVLKNLNITLQKTNVMLDDVQSIVSDTKEITEDVTVKYQQLNEMLAQVASQLGGVFGNFFSKEEEPVSKESVVVNEQESKGSM
ncbi:MAG: hypothetical protein ACRC5Q_05260 [Culicoidibacterales bacterium]